MSKTVFRYFFDFLDGQEKWLNSMAEQGYRLKKCGRMTYTFDECKSNEYEYAVEFVGDKAYSKAKDYRRYLESMGFRTFTKSINLNFSCGKVRWRPYAKGMGQIATSPGGFNKELLILEKVRDGKPFELHSDVRDKLDTYKTVRRTYSWAVLLMLGLAAMTFIPDVSSMSITMTWVLRAIILFLSILFVIPTIKYSLLVSRLKAESKIFE
jgi:hypothetical protein